MPNPNVDRGRPTFRCIERDPLQRAFNAPVVGSERHVVLPSASDEADAKIFLADSSRLLSPVRRCEPEDRCGVGIEERGPSEPRTPATTARSTEQRIDICPEPRAAYVLVKAD